MMRHETWPMKVAKFHRKFNIKEATLEESNSEDIKEVLEDRDLLMDEEMHELMEAWVTFYYALEDENAERVLKEICDVIYVLIGTAESFGWNIETAFNKVHDSNMSKDGGWVEGKTYVTKGKDYVKADLSNCI